MDEISYLFPLRIWRHITNMTLNRSVNKTPFE